MNRIGIFAKTFAGSEPAEVLLAAKDAGFDCVQFNMTCAGLEPLPEAIAPSVCAIIAAAARDTGVAIVALSGTTNMAHPDPAVRLDGRRRLAALIAAAPACGVDLVTLCTGTRDPHDQWQAHPDNRTHEAWRDLMAEMAAAIEMAERHDVFLGIEPEAGNVVRDAPMARRFVDELASDRIRIVLDPANLVDGVPLVRSRDVVTEAIDLLADRLGLAHAKDRDIAGTPVAPGQGIVDFPAFFDRLNAVGFEGPVVAHGFTAAEAAPVRAFLSSVVPGRGR